MVSWLMLTVHVCCGVFCFKRCLHSLPINRLRSKAKKDPTESEVVKRKICPFSSRFLFAPFSSREPVHKLFYSRHSDYYKKETRTKFLCTVVYMHLDLISVLAVLSMLKLQPWNCCFLTCRYSPLLCPPSLHQCWSIPPENTLSKG